MEKIAEFSSRLLEALSGSMTATQLAEKLGMSKQTISAYTTGTRSPKRPVVYVMAEILRVNPLWLLGYDVSKYDIPQKENLIPPGFEPLPKMVKKPLVGSIACGEPILAEENIEEYIDVPENIHCDFCLRCKGESMIEAGVQDGDVVYIRRQEEVENGEIAAVRIDGEATLKRVHWDAQKQTLMLIPANSTMLPMIYSGPAIDTIRIEGKAIGFTHWF